MRESRTTIPAKKELGRMAQEVRLLQLLCELEYPFVGQLASPYAVLAPGKLRYQLLEWLFERCAQKNRNLCSIGPIAGVTQL